MGDAGYILFGPVGRELLAGGTVVFAIFATGGQLLAGQIALASLSDGRLCLMLYTGIFAVPTFLASLPRTLDRLSWLSIPQRSCPSWWPASSAWSAPASTRSTAAPSRWPGRRPTSSTAFVSITNPVFAYAGEQAALLTAVCCAGRRRACLLLC